MIYIELFVSFLLIGFTSFGGMSMIPLINAEMLRHGWMTATEVSDIVAIAEMTPGPLGINCATFAGTRVAGIPGALCASRLLQNALYGIRPVCIGMIAAVIIQLSLTNYAGSLLGVSWQAILIGLASFAVLYFGKWSVSKTILLSAGLGLILGGL